jgi:hypothetical protein
MLNYKFVYTGDVIIGEDTYDIPGRYAMYTVAPTEAKAMMNIKWRLHNLYKCDVKDIKLTGTLKVVGGGNKIEDEYKQLSLMDLFPEVFI